MTTCSLAQTHDTDAVVSGDPHLLDAASSELARTYAT
jgi:hypothetical protein